MANSDIQITYSPDPLEEIQRRILKTSIRDAVPPKDQVDPEKEVVVGVLSEYGRILYAARNQAQREVTRALDLAKNIQRELHYDVDDGKITHEQYDTHPDFVKAIWKTKFADEIKSIIDRLFWLRVGLETNNIDISPLKYTGQGIRAGWEIVRIKRNEDDLLSLLKDIITERLT